MYPFITHTWNPLGGKCLHGCSYCSTEGIGKRYEGVKQKYSGNPKLYFSEFCNLGKGNFIFVVAQNDLFADGVSDEIVRMILSYACKFENKYLFQSKNPERMYKFKDLLPKGSVVCTTIESNFDYPESGGIPVIERVYAMAKFSRDGFLTYVTIEPVMSFDYCVLVPMIRCCSPEQVNIGADSKCNKLNEPTKKDLLTLIDHLERFTVVNIKTNLMRLLK